MAAKRTSKPEEKPEPVGEPADEVTVEQHPNGWSLVTVGCWQISVGPDGLIMLPRSLRPEDVEDFVCAAQAAAEIGAQVRSENARRGAKDEAVLSSRRLRMTRTRAGKNWNVQQLPPTTAQRNTGTPQRQRAAIGRGRSNVRLPKPADTQSAPQWTPPLPKSQ